MARYKCRLLTYLYCATFAFVDGETVIWQICWPACSTSTTLWHTRRQEILKAKHSVSMPF